jgi:hypothetical protein
MSVEKGRDSFLDIHIKPAANLSKIEEVLIITEKQEREPSLTDAGPMRAVDILADRLPSVPEKPVDPAAKPAGTVATPANGLTQTPVANSSAAGTATRTKPPQPVHKAPESAPKPETAQPKPKTPEAGANGQDQAQ